jgi:hypothetical protein
MQICLFFFLKSSDAVQQSSFSLPYNSLIFLSFYTSNYYGIRIYRKEIPMSEKEYFELWHYSEQFTRDRLQRSELVTMAWKEGQQLGNRRTIGLMKSMMHFRSKELDRRSAFPAKDVGKRTLDAWNHERVYIDRPMPLGEFQLPVKINPLDYVITNDFLNSLSDSEMSILNDLSAGYNMKEISQRNSIDKSRLTSLRQSLQHKAVAYL